MYDDDFDDASDFVADCEFNDAIDWVEDGNMNPYGTIDCGDGYVTDDGIFVEY